MEEMMTEWWRHSYLLQPLIVYMMILVFLFENSKKTMCSQTCHKRLACHERPSLPAVVFDTTKYTSNKRPLLLKDFYWWLSFITFCPLWHLVQYSFQHLIQLPSCMYVCTRTCAHELMGSSSLKHWYVCHWYLVAILHDIKAVLVLHLDVDELLVNVQLLPTPH